MFQSEWRACSKCNLLVHGEGEVGRCRVGGSPSPHRTMGASYALAIDTPNAPGQHGWGACITCGAMVFGKGGPCPGSGAGHQPAATDYAVPHSGDGAQDPSFEAGLVVQQGWRWCSKCASLWRDTGVPVTGCVSGVHGPPGGGAPSGRYALRASAQVLRVRTPVRRIAIVEDGSLKFTFTRAASASSDGTTLGAGEGAWAYGTLAPNQPDVVWCKADYVEIPVTDVTDAEHGRILTAVYGGNDVVRKNACIGLLNQHLLTPDLLIELHAADMSFAGRDWLEWSAPKSILLTRLK